MVRTNQGGSILSFVVLGSIMALLFVGGAYMVRHNLVPGERSPQIASSGDEGEPPTNTKPNPAPGDDHSRGTGHSEPKTPASDTKHGTEGSGADKAAPQSASSGGEQTSNGLPTTGPSSMFFAGIMLSSLVALLMSYMRSRRFDTSL